MKQRVEGKSRWVGQTRWPRQQQRALQPTLLPLLSMCFSPKLASVCAVPGPASREAGPAAAGRRQPPRACRPSSRAFEYVTGSQAHDRTASPELADHANSREQLLAAWWIGGPGWAASDRRNAGPGPGDAGDFVLLGVLGT